jgi:hypothetical protein
MTSETAPDASAGGVLSAKACVAAKVNTEAVNKSLKREAMDQSPVSFSFKRQNE